MGPQTLDSWFRANNNGVFRRYVGKEKAGIYELGIYLE
jgi:hypothetical protein